MGAISSLILAAALAAPMAAPSQAPAAYSVAVRISDNGRLVGAPTLILAQGGSARVEMDGGYRVEASLTARSASELVLKTAVSRSKAGEWVVIARPTMVLAQGGRAQVRTSGADGDVDLVIGPKESLPPS